MAARLLIAALSATLAYVPCGSHAQSRVGDDAVAPRAIAASYEQLQEALTPRLFGADDAASRWILGRLATLEPAAQTRDYAAAVARDPKQLLYVASLADACMRGGGAMAECTERDPVGYWASRDADNAVPWLLQAERARRRNNVPSLVENLDRASRSARYDTYDHRAGAVLLSKLAAVTAAPDRGVAALYVVEAAPAGVAPLQAIETLCSSQGRALDPRIASACGRLGALMAERANVLVDRRAGTQVALAAAATDAARATASDQARGVVAQQERCREALQSLERAALGAPAERERAAALGAQFVERRAKDGEVAACDALARAPR